MGKKEIYKKYDLVWKHCIKGPLCVCQIFADGGH